MCVRVLQAGEYSPTPVQSWVTRRRIFLFRNGGHIDPPLFHDYLWLKSDFGVESAKRIIRFRRAHHSALRQAVEEIGAVDHSQIRDTEMLDIYFDRDTFDKEVKALEAWRKDMPEEAKECRVVEGSEAVKVVH